MMLGFALESRYCSCVFMPPNETRKEPKADESTGHTLRDKPRAAPLPVTHGQNCPLPAGDRSSCSVTAVSL